MACSRFIMPIKFLIWPSKNNIIQHQKQGYKKNKGMGRHVGSSAVGPLEGRQAMTPRLQAIKSPSTPPLEISLRM